MDYVTEHEIRHLVYQAAELQDRGRVKELAALFRHGEVILAGVGQVFSGSESVREFLRSFVYYDANGARADPLRVYATSRTTQYIANFEAHFDEAGSPSATSRFIVLQQRGHEARVVLGGRYVDSFMRVEDRLWFRRRIMEVELLGDSVGYLSSNPWAR